LLGDHPSTTPTVSQETEFQTITSTAINELAGALAKAQLKIRGSVKDSSNPFFKSKYSDLASVWDACHEALNENGICVMQSLEGGIGKVRVKTVLAHSSGQWICGAFEGPVARQNDIQAVGSCATYLRRYSLAAMVGVCPVDDDGEAAVGRSAEPAKKSSSKKLSTSQFDHFTRIMEQGKWTEADLESFAGKAFGVSLKDLTEEQGVDFLRMLEKKLEINALKK
jgi:hypothetical protein